MSGFSSKFDADLQFGKEGEKWLLWLGSQGAKVEVKTERDQWATTGNIVFEFYCHGRKQKTGIAVTEADFWVHLLHKDGVFKGGFVWETSSLKAFLRKVHANPSAYGAKVARGGDNKFAEMIVVPISQMHRINESD